MAIMVFFPETTVRLGLSFNPLKVLSAQFMYVCLQVQLSTNKLVQEPLGGTEKKFAFYLDDTRLSLR